MKKIIKRILTSSLILVFGGFFLLCDTITSGEEISKEEPIASKKFDNTLGVILQIDKTTYQLREPIFMHLILTNEKTNESAKLTFSSTQRYDFVVTKEGKEIWRWSKDKLFAMMLGEVVLEPGESLRSTETWEQRDDKGEFILPGRYNIVGILKTRSEIVSEPVIVEIKDSVATSQ